MVKLVKPVEKKKRINITKEKVLLIPKILVPALTPFLCFVIMEYTWRNRPNGTLHSNPFATIAPILIILNLLFFYAFWGLFFSLTRRTSVASYVTIAVSFIWGLANYYVMDFRNAPISVSDLEAVKTATAVSNTYSYVPTLVIVILFVLAIILVVLNVFFKAKLPDGKKVFTKILVRVVPAVICICVLVGVTKFVSREDIRRIIPDYNNTLFLGSVMSEEDGLVLSFVSSIKYINVDKPDDYSNEKAKEILDKNKDDSIWNTSKISKTNPDSKSFDTKVKNANIVVIMNECFSDIGILGDLETNIDYMPFTRKLMNGEKNTISGYFYSSVIAGGTANTEFEFLTGDTMAFLPPGSVPYQQFLSNNTESMASDLKKQNYTTIGTHPYVGYGWNRRNAYPLLGFEDIKFKIDMPGLRPIRVYTDDQSYYEYLERYVFYQKQPFFSFNVTMQNHGGYSGDLGNTPICVKMAANESSATNNYLSLIKYSDDAFKKLIDYFQSRKEPTIVVMFGDHQPNDYVVEPLYNSKNKLLSDLKDAKRFERYKVPVVMWANYDIPEENKLLTSANYMGGMVTKLAGCKTSSYQNYLEKLRAKIPVICSQGYTGTDGKYRDLETIDDYDKNINDYKILNYYNIFEEDKR